MYENEISEAAMRLATRYDKPPTKCDRQYSRMLVELTDTLEQLGLSSWKTGVPPQRDADGQRYNVPKARMVGVELSTGKEVEMDLYNNHHRFSPKHIAVAVARCSGRGIIIGVHVGTLRLTDLRTRTTYYDDVIWAQRHFEGQLRVDQYNCAMQAEPGTVEKQMAWATEQLVELGITDVRHAMLPKPDELIVGITMVPYLVGMYGAMPCAIRLVYKDSTDLRMEFYIVSPSGVPDLDFGYLVIGPKGGVKDKMMDIGKLIAGPKGTP